MAESSEQVKLEFSGDYTLQTLPDRALHSHPGRSSGQHILLGQPVQEQRIANKSEGERITVPENRAHQVQHARSAAQIFQDGVPADAAREPPFPMVQRLIWIGGPPNRLEQCGQDLCQLMSLMWIA